MENLNAEFVSKRIIEELQHLKLDINYIVAQCFDTASLLSGHLTDVQARTQERITHAIYVHCHAHRLNLVIAGTCSSITQCQEVFAFAQDLYIFSSSCRHHELFVKAQQELGQKVLELGRLCETRSCWFDSLQKLHARWKHLGAISVQRADGPSASTGEGLMARLKCYSFLLRLLVSGRIFKIFNNISELQNENLNLSNAMELVAINVAALQEMRTSESKWKELCDEAEIIAKEFEIAIPGQAVATAEHSNTKTAIRPKKITSKLALFFVFSTLGQSSPHDVPKSTHESIKSDFYYPVLDSILAELNRRCTFNSSLLSVLTACDPKSENFLAYEKLKIIADHYGSTGTDFDSLDAEVEVAEKHIAPKNGLQFLNSGCSHGLSKGFPVFAVYCRYCVEPSSVYSIKWRGISLCSESKELLRIHSGRQALR
ncbi:zinc finger MYM-type protein 1-like [Terrapene carolina triunguis]|uniref:zinc finger MYM-type protein 1-like n=1 Tax=Terrapene triunguis TaxID=2587831 RepID=UPI000E77E574|nr:zinc finger MYM-type protein 1-like [Terrapene carolina triunguis]XP_026516659.1 zinc finger MYM-type protein 1-like [Terrapene carolina triunguis]XP_029769615.1 zinc finger MYM-type protein 1-like [Terrapene carolina triunguis]